MKKYEITLGIIAILVLLGGIFVVYRNGGIGAAKYNAEKTPFSVLMQSSPDFAQAQSAADAGNYQQAKTLYQQSFNQATDDIQKGQIAYKQALLEDHFGDPIKAIDMYKAIVADPTYDSYKIIKAYAVEAMAELHYRNLDPKITTEIFKDKPYSGLAVEGRTELSYRHLDEYATTFYPLGLAELRIAEWYATGIDVSPSPDGTATSTYPALIQQAVKLADNDIERTKNDPNASTLIPDILVRKESLYVRMYFHKLATADEVEQVCKDAMAIYSTPELRYQDGFARYYYAKFLSSQASRSADVKAVLAPLYTDSGYKGSYILTFFANEKSNLFAQKKTLVKLATSIPEFKTFLISLGWTSSDF